MILTIIRSMCGHSVEKRALLIDELFNKESLPKLLGDLFGNFVIQLLDALGECLDLVCQSSNGLLADQSPQDDQDTPPSTKTGALGPTEVREFCFLTFRILDGWNM